MHSGNGFQSRAQIQNNHKVSEADCATQLRWWEKQNVEEERG